MVVDERSLSTLETQAGELARKKQWDEEAITLNEEIIALDPENSLAHTRLAKCYMSMDDLETATSLYRKILEFDPRNSIALNFIMRIEAEKVKPKRGRKPRAKKD